MSSNSEPDPSFVLTPSRGFNEWLTSVNGSLAFTTYQAGKVFFLGVTAAGKPSVFERSFPRCMGLAADAEAGVLLLATHTQIYRFDNIMPKGGQHEGYDALFAPKQTWITGDLDVHDIAFGTDGPVFVNTLFNCLSTLSEGYSFRPLWQPSFISRLAAEDRCHLNGLAMEDGAPRYVTCVANSDVADGWRDRRTNGGLVIDVHSGDIVTDGLSMPHSPRLHEGRLWLLNSGHGEFGYVEPETGRFNPIAFCPGYARGLSIVDRYAVIGLSKPREKKTFSGLPLDDALSKRGVDARCGLIVVDLKTGDTVEWVRIEGVVSELYDVVFLPELYRPSAIGLKGREIRKVINVDGDL